MADFLIIKTRAHAAMILFRIGEPPFYANDLQPGESQVIQSCAYDFIQLDSTVGHNMWDGLAKFLLENHIEHTCFIKGTHETDSFVTRYYLTIPDETNGIFFKMRFADQLNRVSRTG